MILLVCSNFTTRFFPDNTDIYIYIYMRDTNFIVNRISFLYQYTYIHASNQARHERHQKSSHVGHCLV